MWDTPTPQFTNCFRKSVLVWIPCCTLWVLSGFDVIFALSSRRKMLPWTVLSLLKTQVAFILLILAAIDLIVAISASTKEIGIWQAELHSAILKMISFVRHILLIQILNLNWANKNNYELVCTFIFNWLINLKICVLSILLKFST